MHKYRETELLGLEITKYDLSTLKVGSVVRLDRGILEKEWVLYVSDENDKFIGHIEPELSDRVYDLYEFTDVEALISLVDVENNKVKVEILTSIKVKDFYGW